MTRVRVALSLLLPILVLAAQVAQLQYTLSQGREVTLAIEGYDPRHLLSGHYVTYRVNYDVERLCRDHDAAADTAEAAHVCLEPREFRWGTPKACPWAIRGHCQGGRFIAGIERFYIPEAGARALDRAVRDGRGAIVVAVTADGAAQVKELLIEGRSWRAWLPDAPK